MRLKSPQSGHLLMAFYEQRTGLGYIKIKSQGTYCPAALPFASSYLWVLDTYKRATLCFKPPRLAEFRFKSTIAIISTMRPSAVFAIFCFATSIAPTFATPLVLSKRQGASNAVIAGDKHRKHKKPAQGSDNNGNNQGGSKKYPGAPADSPHGCDGYSTAPPGSPNYCG
ncbi:hypothetical protein F5148DRAFT_497397 [Russula earlei]|uniref:Uncharacterized protein n=1 Tax=Russula earlei TaxID=71964 RepID=A0ACC0TXH1_9AGAM|nr:hypothetical protein F5148DRAFT_497397 [Russula earlei]